MNEVRIERLKLRFVGLRLLVKTREKVELKKNKEEGYVSSEEKTVYSL